MLFLLLVRQLLKLLLFNRLGVLIFFNLTGLVLLHTGNLLSILFVLNVIVSVEVVIKVDDLSERDPVQDLDPLKSRIVKSEPIQGNGQYGWSSNQLDTLLCILLGSTLFAKVLIVTLQNLWLNVILQGHLY